MHIHIYLTCEKNPQIEILFVYVFDFAKPPLQAKKHEYFNLHIKSDQPNQSPVHFPLTQTKTLMSHMYKLMAKKVSSIEK